MNTTNIHQIKKLSIELNNLIECVMQITSFEMNYKPTILLLNSPLNFNEAFIREVNFKKIPVISVDKLESEHKIDGSVLVVIYTENCEDFVQLNHKFSENHKYLIITQEPKNKCGEVSKNTSIPFIMRDITCVTKVNNGSSYIIKTATVEIEDKTCNIVDQPIFKEINSCNSGFLKINQSVFPKKNLRNFRKCNFNVGMGTLSPYATMEKKHLFYNLASINLSNISGSDVELIKIIADHFNSTLKVYYIMKDEENRFAHNEFIKFLLNGSLDVCAGGLYRIYGDVVDYSGVYTRQAIVWAYGVERDTRSWQSFLHKIKDLYFFLIFFGFYVAMSWIFYVINRQHVDIKDTILYSWGAFLGTTSLLRVETMKQKVLDAFFLYMSIHFAAYMSVQLYSYLTIQGPPTLYHTIDDLMSSETKPYLRFSAKYFIDDKRYEAYANTSGSCDNFTHCEEVILKNKGATVLIDGYLPSFQADTATNGEANVLRVSEDILFIYHEMAIRKNSYFVESFQKALSSLFEAGICQKLYNDAIGITVLDKASATSKNMMSNSYSCQVGCEITLVQLAGIFYIWLIGCCLSCLVFIAELALGRHLKLEKSLTRM
ncbi:uncharacterized protein LOC126965489 [Leptidea sinapis]|uniref:uncharacterized protein LOC126965489 n=1 Tax=Leptidea sinapis TaxID=189913 RepID=UPI0021C36FA3|nr:uncharacterized protein LOC126965489 [Leptidea sinapis]